MIRNDREYRTTKSQAEKFAAAVEALDAEDRPPEGVHPRLRRAEADGLRSQLADLRSEMRDYERLSAGTVCLMQVESLDDLPRVLIRGRIAAGLTQRELADRLGLKEQQVQRYETTQYRSASLSRVREVAEALGIAVRKDIFLPASRLDVDAALRRLGEVGLDRDFVLDRLVSEEWADRPGDHRLVADAYSAASRIYGWTPAALLGDENLWLDQGVLGAARFKVAASANAKRLAAYTIYAHYLALQLLRASEHIVQEAVPTDPDVVRAEILNRYGAVTLRAAVSYIWDLGIPVLPLNDAGAFHGACWRVGGRNVLVVKQRTTSLARWLFDVLHEFRHAGADPAERERTVIEASETAAERRESQEEVNCSTFAGDVCLDGRAEDLAAECVAATRGRLERLKRVVPEVAARAGVGTDALANYMAFRLSLQRENWWGTAAKLQEAGEPWAVVRDVLLERAQIARVRGLDRDLLLRALQGRDDQ